MVDLTFIKSDYFVAEQNEYKASSLGGGLMVEIHKVAFDNATSSTIALQKIATVLHVSIGWTEATTGDAFATGGPHWSQSGTTLTIAFAASPGAGTIEASVAIFGLPK